MPLKYRQGRMVTGGVRGQLWCNSRLSGIPDVHLRLNEYFCRQRMHSYSMHPCVRVKPFETDHVLEFIPPDGEFSLFEYILHPHPSPALPFSCQPRFVPSECLLKREIFQSVLID